MVHRVRAICPGPTSSARRPWPTRFSGSGGPWSGPRGGGPWRRCSRWDAWCGCASAARPETRGRPMARRGARSACRPPCHFPPHGFRRRARRRHGLPSPPEAGTGCVDAHVRNPCGGERGDRRNPVPYRDGMAPVPDREHFSKATSPLRQTTRSGTCLLTRRAPTHIFPIRKK